MVLERQRGVAVWRQIADRIRAAIWAGNYDETGFLPPETQLAADFSVNRHTVRAALQALAQEGLVQSLQGRGTMIMRREKFNFPLTRRTRFRQGLGDQARDLRGELLSSHEDVANAVLAKQLDLPEQAPLIRLETLAFADGLAISRSTAWFPHQRFAGIDQIFARTQSITQALLHFGVEDYMRASTEISAIHGDVDDVAALGLTPGAILLVGKALNVDLEGRPVQYAISRFAADRVKFTIENADLQDQR